MTTPKVSICKHGNLTRSCALCELKDELTAALSREAALREAKDQAYTERNHVVAALAHLFPSGIRKTEIEGWNPEWHGCVYIDLPSGQIRYHYHDSQAHLFADLPPYTKKWDGHCKEEVHMRLAAIDEARRA